MLPSDGFSGFQPPDTAGSEFNALRFFVQSLLERVSTATLVKVEACTNDGGLTPVGFVDITPLVNQVTGDGVAVPHGTIYHCPYFRIQGGANAVIIDPEPGDLGIAVFADHDISSVASNKGQANPGSRRRFDMADGLYLGGFLNGAPTQYVQFSAAGIKIDSPTLVNLVAPDVQINAQTLEVNASTKVTMTSPIVEIDAATNVTITTPTFTINGATVLNGPISQGMGTAGGAATLLGPVAVTHDVTAEGKSLATHTHNDPQGGTTGTPN
jgi:hypothetical protein